MFATFAEKNSPMNLNVVSMNSGINLRNGIKRFVSSKKRQDKLVELSLSPDSIGDAEFIYCADKEAWDFLSKIFDEADCYGLDEDCGYGSKFYAYDFDFNLWYDVVQRMNEYHEILDSMNQFIGEDE